MPNEPLSSVEMNSIDKRIRRGENRVGGLVHLNCDEARRLYEMAVAEHPDAKLIAAAPEMYELLVALRDSEHKLPSGFWTKIYSVIEKAGGK